MINNLASLSKRLESLCERILIANGYRVMSKDHNEDWGADIIIAGPGTEEQIGVEIKLYRSPKVERTILRNAAVQIVHYKQATGAKGMLIATTTFDERDLKLLKNIGVDEVWGIQELSVRAEASVELSAELEQLLRDAELGYAGVPVGVQTEIAEARSSRETPQPAGEQ